MSCFLTILFTSAGSMRDIDVIDVLRQVISFTTVCIYVYAIFAFVSVDVVCILVVPLPIGTVG